ncbi:MAG: response regulator transcription factor [Chitinophagales bacterium]|nr:response regulator transcription factor [Chitinophagales bacterium]
MTNVIIYDDNMVTIRGLREYFKGNISISILSDFNLSHDLHQYLNTSNINIHVILLALHTQENLGPELIHQLKQSHPISNIIAYSTVNHTNIINCCFDSGASDYYHLLEPLSILENKILNIQDKEVEFNKTYPKLTSKEKLLLDYLILGMTSKEIAHNLGISVNTINNQKSHLISKFDCVSSTHLVIRLLRLGLISL